MLRTLSLQESVGSFKKIYRRKYEKNAFTFMYVKVYVKEIKELKEIHIAKKKRHLIIRHQIKPLFLKFSLIIENKCTKIFSRH